MLPFIQDQSKSAQQWDGLFTLHKGCSHSWAFDRTRGTRHFQSWWTFWICSHQRWEDYFESVSEAPCCSLGLGVFAVLICDMCAADRSTLCCLSNLRVHGLSWVGQRRLVQWLQWVSGAVPLQGRPGTGSWFWYFTWARRERTLLAAWQMARSLPSYSQTACAVALTWLQIVLEATWESKPSWSMFLGDGVLSLCRSPTPSLPSILVWMSGQAAFVLALPTCTETYLKNLARVLVLKTVVPKGYCLSQSTDILKKLCTGTHKHACITHIPWHIQVCTDVHTHKDAHVYTSMNAYTHI